jgi:DNA invertase Pin-like site-specific DNA recombinase
MKPVAYAYSRYSTPAQAAGDSLRRQLAAAEAFAAEHGLELDTTLHDPGVSAFTGAHRANGALGSFLRRIETGEIAQGSYLLVDSFDRLTRETVVEAVNLLTGIALKGVRVVTLNDGRVYDASADMMGLMWALMQFARGHEESAEKGRKVAAAHAENRRRAREEGRPWTPVGPHWLELVDGVWKVRPERLAVVKRIFEMRESGLGNAFIAKTFNLEGVPTPTGRGRWFNSTVADIAASRAVLGEYQPYSGHRRGKPRQPDGPPIPDYYPAIIDAGLFHRVQAMNAERQNPHARPASKAFPNLLVGLVRCAECGGTAGYLRSTFPKAPNWRSAGVIRCNQVYRGLCGNRARIPYDELEADLLPFIASLPLSGAAAPSSEARALAIAKDERAALTSKIEALLDQVEAGGRVGDRLRQREIELADLERRIAELKAKASAPVTPAADAQAELVRLEAAMREASGDDLYRIRARINATLGRLLRGGALMEGGRIVLRFDPADVRGKGRLLVDTARGGRIRVEVATAEPITRKGRMNPVKR